MNTKNLIIGSLLFAFVTICSANEELKINGEFKNAKNNIPENWTLNKKDCISGFKIEKSDSGNILTITLNQSIYLYTSPAFNVKADDHIQFTLEIKGKGKALIGFFPYRNEAFMGKNICKVFVSPATHHITAIVLSLFKEYILCSCNRL